MTETTSIIPTTPAAQVPATVAATHYPTPAAKCADLVVHLAGLACALLGGGIMLGLAFGLGSLSQVAAIAVYTVGLITMLSLSTAYNFAKARWRPLLRRFDHAGIFIMIAASYTPFTTQNLHGWWAIGMTTAVWSVAGVGVAAKLFLPGLDKRFWVGLYLALGWLVLVAIKPMIAGMGWAALLLLALGGVIYSTGTVFYLMKRLKFRRAIWHGHVIGGAGLHYAAVLVGVVLASSGHS
ncbi:MULTISPECIES: PAQR family membrane homeostasis protein TrhA [Caulobacter]|jgi:hemolysin III|uniref:Hemolysin III n=1 Tax=Caulobacter rhizosphaerae TaxID=2010972 RepID=A0ABU1MWM0_9CAUL|nr:MULTISPECIES: hemolysin III family protein [Caulobacter]KQZ28451.1 hemolysin III [Caulobacter sp. Root1472]MDR6530570.1 hemolysin III [Caulobacter rhizosphaerae]GGL20433.1 hemolysin III [Caulobacter rhizosphaerae]